MKESNGATLHTGKVKPEAAKDLGEKKIIDSYTIKMKTENWNKLREHAKSCGHSSNELIEKLVEAFLETPEVKQ